ncbi:MAG: hypothetical protein H0T46_19055 [Deltaproteobacteria bacterium]|nr:hypothetical protein [Deltaproteobacteria bacterium]
MHPDFEELLCEIDCLRAHNFEIERGASQQHPLVVAEGALIVIALERFLRIVLGERATGSDTLHNLLEKAASGNDPLLLRDDRTDLMIKLLTTVRNVTLHGNFEQGAANYKHKFPERTSMPEKTVADFLRTSFGNDTAVIYGYLLGLVGTLDPACAREHMDRLPRS